MEAMDVEQPIYAKKSPHYNEPRVAKKRQFESDGFYIRDESSSEEEQQELPQDPISLIQRALNGFPIDTQIRICRDYARFLAGVKKAQDAISRTIGGEDNPINID